MMNFFKRLSSKLSAEDREIIRNEFFLNNLQRWKIYMWLAIPISLAHIIIFTVNLADAEPNEYSWRTGIIIMHAILILIAAFFGIYAYQVIKKRRTANRFDQLMGPLFYLILMFSGAMIAKIDQQVTVAITPFLVVCIISAFLLLVRPIFIIGISIASYLFFFLLIQSTHPDPDQLLSDQVNGLSAIGLAIGLATILWNSGLIRYRQTRMIKRQNVELEERSEKLRENARELEKLNATKDRFFSIIAHDLFGPLAGISSYLEVMEDESDSVQSDPKAMKAAMARFRDSVDNTMRLIDNLLTWTRTQRNEIVFIPVNVDLKVIIGHAILTLRPIAEKKNISIELKGAAQPVKITGDANMLETVFRNLLSNAIKFSNHDSHIIIRVNETPQLAIVTFIDQGVGISSANLEKLFKLGEKITSRGTDREPGTGLGLILCHEFITHHNGRILVESEPSRGSTFTVELPVSVLEV